MTDNLPNYRLADNFDNIMKTISKDIEAFFVKNLNMSDDYKELVVAKDFLENKKNPVTYSILNDNKNLLL